MQAVAALRGQFGGHQVMTVAEGAALRANGGMPPAATKVAATKVPATKVPAGKAPAKAPAKKAATMKGKATVTKAAAKR